MSIRSSSDRVLVGVITRLLFASARVAAADEVTLYSFREPYRIAPIIRAFEAETGIQIKIVHAKEGLIEAIAADGSRSPADVLLAEDFGMLLQARDAGITQPIKTPHIDRQVPAIYRDPQGDWVGITRHARVVYASKTRVPQAAISYEELAEPKWRGKVCIHPGAHTYNLSLIAAMIAHHGGTGAKRWLIGLKNNLGRMPQGNDRAQVKAIHDGVCDVALVNTYYMGEMKWSYTEQAQWANAAKILVPNTEGRGSHTSVAGVSLMKHAPNKTTAIQFIEFLVSDIGQQIHALLQYAYPVSPSIPASDLDLVKEVGFDNGPRS